MARHIKYLALAFDGKILADHTHWDRDEGAREKYDEVLRNIFSSAGWAAVRETRRNKLELKSGRSIYTMEIDASGRVFAAVITIDYPIRHIFSSSSSSHTPRLMAEFSAHVTSTYPHESVASPPGGLKRTLKPFLRDLATRFDDLDSLDKISLVRGKLADVQTAMATNLRMADERQSLLEGSDARTRLMEGSARRMLQRGAAIGSRRRCCCGCSALAVTVLTLLVCVVIAAVIIALNYAHFRWWR